MYIPEFACGLVLGLIIGVVLMVLWAIRCGKKEEEKE